MDCSFQFGAWPVQGLIFSREGVMSKIEIMIVDDSDTTVELLGYILEKLGHHVSKICKNGVEAVETYNYLISKGLPRPDLITMDISMPEMDGISATRRILGMDPAARIVMVSGNGQAEMVSDAIKSGAKGYVLKPFGGEKVAEAIKRAMASKR